MLVEYLPADSVPSVERDDGPMIEKLHIKNFRCLQDFSIEDLGLINIIVGDNGSGKTALLESIFLSQTGTPEVALRLRLWRGLGREFAFDNTRRGYDDLWSNLFTKLDNKKRIDIHADGSGPQVRRLSIYYDPNATAKLDISKGVSNMLSEAQFESSAIIPITFEYSQKEGPPIKFQPLVEKDKISFHATGLPSPSLSAFFASSFASVVPPSEVAAQFSELNKVKKTKAFKQTMRKLYPAIEDIGTETEAGSLMLFCDVKGIPERVPIGLISSGSHKLASLLLGIAAHSKGVVLIDEMDNGFYYQKLQHVWTALYMFCKEHDTQIFATTHSKECLQSLLPVVHKDPRDFRLIRMESIRGTAKATIFQGDELEAAVRTKTEVR